MNLLHKAFRAFHHMSDEERLFWILIVGAALYWSFSTLKRRWRRRRREDAAEGHRNGHVAARYKTWDEWLKKIGYPKGGKEK